METVGRSTLHKQVGRLIGFGFLKHPARQNWGISVVLYWVEPDLCVFCMGEFRGRPRPQDMKLGEMVSGEIFAPYAQRSVKGMKLEDIKQYVKESWPNSKFQWWQDPLDNGE